MKQGRLTDTYRVKRRADTTLGKPKPDVPMAFTLQIRSGAEPPGRSAVRRKISLLVVRDTDQHRLHPLEVPSLYPAVRVAHFDCDAKKIPIQGIAAGLRMLDLVWLRSAAVLDFRLVHWMSAVVITLPIKHATDLPPLDWLRAKRSCAELGATAVEPHSALWPYLDQLETEQIGLHSLYVSGRCELDALETLKVFNGVPRRKLYLLNPYGSSDVLTNSSHCLGALVQTRFELSSELRVLWLDCFWATSFFLVRSTSGKRAALPHQLHTLMLALAPYGTDPMSQASSLMAVQGLCKDLRVRKLVLKFPYRMGQNEPATAHWIRTVCHHFAVNAGPQVQEIVVVPDMWVSDSADLHEWRSMCGANKLPERVKVLDKPFLPDPSDCLFSDHSDGRR